MLSLKRDFSFHMGRRAKTAAIGFGAGFILIGLLARYLRRRKRFRFQTPKTISRKVYTSTLSKNTNGDVKRITSPAFPRPLHRQGSVSLFSDHNSIASTHSSTITPMTPQQLGLMGMEALETAINYWEDASLGGNVSQKTARLAIADSENSKFTQLVRQLLDSAYSLQRDCESLFLNHSSGLYTADSGSAVQMRNTLDTERRTIISMSSVESFVSAQGEVANLQDLEEFYDLTTDFQQLVLYQMALKQLEDGGIPYRSLRTEIVKCQTDFDFIAKLHCIRLAYQLLFQDDTVRRFFVEGGLQLLADLLIRSDKDPGNFLTAFEDMMLYVQDVKHWSIIEEELRGRGVKCMSFYDIVLDFILMDAFEDLENPPSTVMAVVQNRWLSNGFKEVALGTAVWSVLKAKKRLLKFPDGFISHFYAISEHVSPVLAWGFLGPEQELKELCEFFKSQVLGYLCDIFSFNKVRYTSVEDMAEDIFNLSQERHDVLSRKLSTAK